MYKRFFITLVSFFISFTTLPAMAGSIAVTLPPIHSLALAITKGTPHQPFLLSPSSLSAHHMQLRPSEIQAAHHANMLIYLSPKLESFIPSLKKTLSSNTTMVEVMALPGLTLHPIRQGKEWQHHAHHDDHHHHEEHDHEKELDAHLWLDPTNAIAISKGLLDVLSQYFPENSEQFSRNYAALKIRLEALDQQIKQQLAPLKEQHFMALHDTYQYFEQRYHVHASGTMTLNHQAPSARHMHDLRKMMKEEDIRCIAAEPYYKGKESLLTMVTEGLSTPIVWFDPMGYDIPSSDTQYEEILLNMSKKMVECLGTTQ